MALPMPHWVSWVVQPDWVSSFLQRELSTTTSLCQFHHVDSDIERFDETRPGKGRGLKGLMGPAPDEGGGWKVWRDLSQTWKGVQRFDETCPRHRFGLKGLMRPAPDKGGGWKVWRDLPQTKGGGLKQNCCWGLGGKGGGIVGESQSFLL